MLLTIAERFRDALVPFLVAGTALLLLLLTILIVQRLLRGAAEVRRQALTARYRPLVDAALASDEPAAAAAAAAIPERHRAIAADLVLATLRVVRGAQNARARALAEGLGLTAHWRGGLRARRWWHRSEAALALGLLRDGSAVASLIPLLDDDHEQVRAAAIDALGQIGDAAAVPALLARMGEPTRHERARLIQALRAFGDTATQALVMHGRSQPQDRALVATVLSYVGGTAAGETLLEWSADRNAAVRAAAWTAIATVGLDERTFYHAVKALNAEEPAVRAAAARALARSGRADASSHLARRLDDEWEVAAQSARALARLGRDGHNALVARVERGPGLGHDLARQVLWESGHR